MRYDRTSFGSQVDRFLRAQHCHVHELCEVDELDTIIQLVANGVGIALVPEVAALQPWPPAVRAIPLGEHTFHRDVGLIHHANSQLSAPARALTQLICEATDP